MSRRHSALKRSILPDPRYNNILVAKFINNLMLDGKKSVARGIVYDAFTEVEKKTKQDPLQLFKDAVSAVEPKIEVKSRRVGGATYQVPMDVSPNRARALAIRWILSAIRNRSERTSVAKLSAELIDITNGKGAALKTRENTHKMAEANRAFSHYKW